MKLYTSNCYNCRVVKRMLLDRKIEFEEITDLDTVVSVGREQGICAMPFAEIEGRYIAGADLIAHIKA